MPTEHYKVALAIAALFIITYTIVSISHTDIIGEAAKTRQLSAPALYSPINNAFVNNPLTFSWSIVPYATSYQLQVSIIDFNTIIYDTQTASTTFTLNTGLSPGMYVWRVRALARNSIGPWSTINTINVNSQTPSYMLSVAKTGTGTGTVASSPTGINCGSTCSANYVSGTIVTLTPAAGAGSRFEGWSGACTGTGACTVTLDSVKSVIAQFGINAQGALTFSDNFSSYTPDICQSGGSTIGPWSIVYTGYGCVKIEGNATNKWLHENPQTSTSSGETHSSMVVGPSFTAPYTYELDINTEQQLRTNSPPNPWETAWVVWDYTDDSHFYYFALKTNGWELGKEDPAYPGAQRFLTTGSSPVTIKGQWSHVKITQDTTNTLKVYVNGQLITTFTDTERPYTSGKIGLYNEDAHVGFDNVNVY
jgi:hypothetical protein